MIKISAFQFKYKDQIEITLQSDSDLLIENSGLYLISGPSGSGKSTFLQLIKGLLPDHTPSDFIGKIDFTDELQNLTTEEIIYLFQNPFHQIIHQSTLLELYFNSENQNISFEQFNQKLHYYTQLLELDLNSFSAKTNELSSGQAQKLLLLSSILCEPKIILLDEPTAFMDYSSREKFYHFLNNFKKNHLVIIIDHHVNEILPFVDEIFEVTHDKKIFSIQKDFFSKQYLEKQATNYSDFIKFKTDLFRLKVETALLNSKSDPIFSRKLTTETSISIKTETQLQIKNHFEIIIQNLNFTYPLQKKSLIKNFSAHWKSGEIIIIQGESGCGKSTLLKLISGFLKNKYQNLIQIKENGQLISLERAKSKMGYLLQNSEDNFLFTTIKDELHHLTEYHKETITQLLNSVDLEKQNFEHSPFCLSEGEKRRLSFLIHHDDQTPILFLDEPTFGLDQEKVYEVAKLILQNKKNNKLQIIISHDPHFIQLVADQVITLGQKSRLNAQVACENTSMYSNLNWVANSRLHSLILVLIYFILVSSCFFVSQIKYLFLINLVFVVIFIMTELELKSHTVKLIKNFHKSFLFSLFYLIILGLAPDKNSYFYEHSLFKINSLSSVIEILESHEFYITVRLFTISFISLNISLLIHFEELVLSLIQYKKLNPMPAYSLLFAVNGIAKFKNQYDIYKFNLYLRRHKIKTQTFELILLLFQYLVFLIRYSENGALSLLARGFTRLKLYYRNFTLFKS